MTARPYIPLAKVSIKGGMSADETIPRARLTLNGTPSVAILFRPDPVNPGSWAQVDRVSDAKVTEQPDGRMTIQGVSDELTGVVGMKPDNAIVTWEVEPLGCQHCY